VVDAPLNLRHALRELLPDTPDDSVLTLKDVMTSPTYRDLGTPKIRPGEPAPDFRLARLDLRDGVERQTGETVTLSAYRQVSPVALIFGSYT
jgi:hypothetical protein